MDPGAILTKSPRAGAVVEEVDIRLRIGSHSKHLPLRGDGLVEE